jgi:hypothetical protein
MHVYHGRLISAQSFLERGSQCARLFDANAMTPQGPSQSRMIEVVKVTCNIPLALPMFDPSQGVVIEHDTDNGDAFLESRHQTIHADGEAAIAADGDNLTPWMEQFRG